MMTLPRALRVTAGVLLVTLSAQLAIRLRAKPETYTFAMWKNNPATLAAAKQLANQIVTAKVTAVQRADDIIIRAPGEPNDEVRIPVEAVSLSVTRTHKGQPAQTVQLFHTGSSVGVPAKDRPAPPDSERPAQPAGGQPKPAQVAARTEEEARTVLLPEDPAYQVGETYVLLLTNGPTVRVGGAAVRTKIVVSPHGRYKVGSDNRLEPVTGRGFAGQQRGKGVQVFERELKQP